MKWKFMVLVSMFCIMLFSFGNALFSETGIIRINDIDAQRGETINLPVLVEDSPLIGAFGMDVQYNTDFLTFVSGTKTGTLTEGFLLFSTNEIASGTVRVGASKLLADDIPAGSNGALGILQFNVRVDAPEGDFNFGLIELKDDIAGLPTYGGKFTPIAPTYRISGLVALVGPASGAPLPEAVTLNLVGVPVHLNSSDKTKIPPDTIALATNPDGQGAYSFADLPGGYEYTITPSLSRYTFVPESRTYTPGADTMPSSKVGIGDGDVVDADFTGTFIPELDISSTAGGSVTTPGEGTYTYDYGTFVDVVATPESSYLFVEWTGTAVDANKVVDPDAATTEIEVDDDYTLIANFAPFYNLSVASSYGSPTPSVGVHKYIENHEVNAAVPSPVGGPAGTRYVCTGWTGTGSVPATGTNNSVDFNILQDSILIWNWKMQYSLVINIDGEGSVDLTPASAGNWYDEGIDVNIEAFPAAGWLFSHWSGDVSGTENPESVAMDGPKSVTAHFMERGFALIPAAAQMAMLFDDGTAKDTELAVGLSYTGGFDEPVNLSASVEPEAAGIDLWFTPHVVVPSGEMDISVMTVSLSADTRPDTYIITVTGESDTVTQTAGITLVANTLVYIPSPLYGAVDTVSIPIEISSSYGIAGFNIEVLFDPLLLEAVDVVTGSLTDGWTVQGNFLVPGRVLIGGFEPSLSSLPGGSGSLAIIEASITGEIPEEGMPLIIQDVLLSDEYGHPSVPFVVHDGLLIRGLPGDLNDDGEINIFDVMLCLRVSLGMDVTIKGMTYTSDEYPGWLIWRADMNGDGAVNIFDVILLLREALEME